nr:RNA-directed DNA polymerase, eukaryota, reverse transcriptase zinc-binding domain protein [Tanacetum cinerariifolium]
VISAMYGSSLDLHSPNISSIWCHILREVHSLALKGFDFLSHCKIQVGDGHNTRFWLDSWISNIPLCERFPCIFALESIQDSSVPAKWEANSFDASFRRQIRDGVERHQWLELLSLLNLFALTPSTDRWVCDLCGDEFVVGGTSNGLMSHRLAIGIVGSFLFGYRLSSSFCWRVFFILLGGSFGPFEITLFLMILLRGAPFSLMTLSRALLIGVLMVVLVLFLGRLG